MAALAAGLVWLAGAARAGYDFPLDYGPVLSSFRVQTATQGFTSNTTLATLSNLSFPLVAGKSYSCSGHLSVSANASTGTKVALVASGGLTVTSISYSALVLSGTATSANATATSLGTAVGATAAVTDIYVSAGIVVNAAGTLLVQGAQNASFATATNFLLNSTFACLRVN